MRTDEQTRQTGKEGRRQVNAVFSCFNALRVNDLQKYIN